MAVLACISIFVQQIRFSVARCSFAFTGRKRPLARRQATALQQTLLLIIARLNLFSMFHVKLFLKEVIIVSRETLHILPVSFIIFITTKKEMKIMGDYISNPVMDVVLSRRSTKDYQRGVQISDAELSTILTAGIWAPTARNTQHIRFYVIQNPEVISTIAKNFSDFAFNDGKVRDFCHGAPTFIMLTGKTDSNYRDVDAGIAVENMSLAAESLGLGSVIIGCLKNYFESEDGRKYASTLGIPEDHTFSIGIAVGQIATPPQAKPRVENRITFIK
jgi:nitroreductase